MMTVPGTSRVVYGTCALRAGPRFSDCSFLWIDSALPEVTETCTT